MFRGFFYAHRVATLFCGLGNTPDDILDWRKFRLICKALRKTGYSAAEAADLLNRVMNRDEEATDELRRATGGLWIVMSVDLNS